jgi:hypothetical protein
MSKLALKPIWLTLLSLVVVATIALPAWAADDSGAYDTVELKSGDTLTGTLLNNTLTVITPYTSTTLEKDNISEINIDTDNQEHDVITLKAGGLLEGTIDEASLSFRLVSGKIISIEKNDCMRIVLNGKK